MRLEPIRPPGVAHERAAEAAQKSTCPSDKATSAVKIASAKRMCAADEDEATTPSSYLLANEAIPIYSLIKPFLSTRQ
jgi:hypothetical protein